MLALFVFCRYCSELYNGRFVMPLSVTELMSHLTAFWQLLLTKGIPSITTWCAYAAFFVVQVVLAAYMPGMTMYGVPINNKGERLVYQCNGFLCYYFCIVGALMAHYLNILPLTDFADHYGEYLVASMIISNVTTWMWYFYGVYVTPETPRYNNTNILHPSP